MIGSIEQQHISVIMQSICGFILVKEVNFTRGKITWLCKHGARSMVATTKKLFFLVQSKKN